MIAIVNYGLGNVTAILNIYARLNVPARLAETPEQLEGADRYILPGVGAFDWAMHRFTESGTREAVERKVQQGAPVLGICVGMQMLAESSEEGQLPGLGWIPGRVRRFDLDAIADRTHLPHMGWNDAEPRSQKGLFKDFEDSRFYFLHSYYFEPGHGAEVICETDYHGKFASGVGRDNVFGVQFHPEKSHHWGINLLKNFSEL